MPNITSDITIPLGTVEVLFTTTTTTTTPVECLSQVDATTTTTPSEQELPITTTPVECLLPADTTTHSTSSVIVTNPSFELVSEPIKVSPTSVNHGPDVIIPFKTTTTGTHKKRKSSKKKGKRGGQSCGERKS